MVRMRKEEKGRLHFSPPSFPHSTRELVWAEIRFKDGRMSAAVLLGFQWARLGLSGGSGQQMETLSGHGDQSQVLQGLHG